MNKLRRVLMILVISMGISIPSFAAESSDETNLHEKLLDYAALVAGGLSYNDSSNQIRELILLSDRYTRRGGNDQQLIAIKDEYISAQAQWGAMLEYRESKAWYETRMPKRYVELVGAEGQARIQRDGSWLRAQMGLDSYVAKKKGKSKALPAKTQSKQ